MPSHDVRERTIAIVGAGFSGAVTAVHLLKHGIGAPLRVLLINRSGRMARGLAYGTRSEQHLLNVPAGRMSPFADDEGHFLRYAQACDPAVTGGSFVPRQLYGEYLEHLVMEAASHAADGARFEGIVDEVADVAFRRDGSVVLLLGAGAAIVANRVVLALGNYAPADPPLVDGSAILATRRYVRDPWRPGALEVASRDRPVLLVGTGLTMLDVALDLGSRGRTAPMHAVSRRGLLPLPHRTTGVPPTFEHRPPDIETGRPSVRHYLHSVRVHVRRMAAEGVDWRDVLTALRPITPALWRRLDTRERARFLRHARPFWEAHRHRSAPRPAALLARMIAEGDLTVHAARLVALRGGPDGIEAVLRRRGQAVEERLVVGAVVNCTGPQSDLRRLDDRLVNALRSRGLICPDPLGLGAEVADDGALLDATGRPSRVLYHVGPLLRARDWEATAVPELRVHAARTAATLIASLAPDRRVGQGSGVDPTSTPRAAWMPAPG